MSLTHCSFWSERLLLGSDHKTPPGSSHTRTQWLGLTRAFWKGIHFHFQSRCVTAIFIQLELEDYCPKPLVGKLFPQLITVTVSDLVLIFCYISRFMSHLLPLARAY